LEQLQKALLFRKKNKYTDTIIRISTGKQNQNQKNLQTKTQWLQTKS